MGKQRKVSGIMLLAAALLCGTAAAKEEQENVREYLLETSDESLLTPEELEAMPPQIIAYAKSEIYARHGMIFESEELAEYFEGQSWYFGFIEEKDFPENMLNETELGNLELLEKQEQDAGEESYELDQEGYSFELVNAYLSGEPVSAEAGGEPGMKEKKEEALSTTGTGEENGRAGGKAGQSEHEREETQTEAGMQAEAKTEAETQAETETEAGMQAETETEAETQAEAKTEAETQAETETEAEPQAKTETEAEKRIETAARNPETEREKGLDLSGNTDEHDVDIFREGFGGEVERMAGNGTEAAGNRAGAQNSAGAENGAAGTQLQGAAEAPGQQAQNAAPQTMQVAVDTEYIFPDVNSRYLSRGEVEALSLQAICYAKNEIYARHGRKFLSEELQRYFGSKSWYQGTVEPEKFTDKVFNIYESQNVQLLAACESALRSDGYQLDQPGYDISLVKTVSVTQTVTIPGDAAQASDTAAGEENSSVAEAASGTVSDEEYLSREYIFADSDMRYLTEEEVSGLSARVACYARYEIYARRGCLFSFNELLQYFSQKSWYSGRVLIGEFSSDLLNKYEQFNIELFRSREFDAAPEGYPLS